MPKVKIVTQEEFYREYPGDWISDLCSDLNDAVLQSAYQFYRDEPERGVADAVDAACWSFYAHVMDDEPSDTALHRETRVRLREKLGMPEVAEPVELKPIDTTELEASIKSLES